MRPISQPYDKGHYLRLFIGMAAFHSGLTGLLLSTQDRTEWALWLQAVIILSVSLSTAAGLGHLFIAWHRKVRQWRLYALIVFLWVPLGAILYRLVISGWR